MTVALSCWPCDRRQRRRSGPTDDLGVLRLRRPQSHRWGHELVLVELAGVEPDAHGIAESRRTGSEPTPSMRLMRSSMRGGHDSRQARASCSVPSAETMLPIIKMPVSDLVRDGHARLLHRLRKAGLATECSLFCTCTWAMSGSVAVGERQRDRGRTGRTRSISCRARSSSRSWRPRSSEVTEFSTASAVAPE